MMRGSGFVLLVLALAGGCGRTSGKRMDSGGTTADAATDAATIAQPDSTLPTDPPPDIFLPSDPPPPDLLLPRDPPPDTIPDFALADRPSDRLLTDLLPDLPPSDGPVDPPLRDVAVPERGKSDLPATDIPPPDGPTIPEGCRALQPLADKGVLTSQHTKKVLFAPDRSWMVLRVQQEDDAGIGHPDQIIRFALPSGTSTILSDSGGDAEALGSSGAVLISGVGSDGKDRVVYDSSGLRTIASAVCAHKATPDGTRVYILRDCGNTNIGTLDVVDIASDKTTQVATNVVQPGIAISPDSNWAAYVIREADAGWESDTIHLVSKSGQTYALASQRGAGEAEFVSNELLLFGVGTGSSIPVGRGDFRGHVPGSGDSSYLVAGGRGTGFWGYEISADGAWLLGVATSRSRDATFPGGELYAIRLDGSAEHLLTADLLPFWYFQMVIDAFGWSADGTRAIYMTEEAREVWTVDPLGTSPTRLSDNGYFRPAKTGDQVILLESVAGGTQNRLRVAALGSGTDVVLFDSNGRVDAPNLLADGRGLLFVNRPAAGPDELRFISTAGGDSVVLGTWDMTQLYLYSASDESTFGSYPVDPTGCFTVVDTDLAPGPGTRLVLLPFPG
jgi:hypothetical protein